jgi:peptidoglycan/xylan/chitin deacetylase (PgdA/CDA1 family)
MSAKRRYLASVLDRVGLSRAVLAARARNVYPWRWLTVVTYHRVAEATARGFDPDVVDASPADFERQLMMLKQYFTLVDTGDLDAWRAGGELPRNPAMITFDDGYRDNHDVVLPILRRHQAKAVFFIATSYVSDRRLYWWEHINHVIADSPLDRLILEVGAPVPQSLDLALGTAAERHTAVKVLLKLVKAEPGLDMEQFLDDLYRSAGLTFNRKDELGLVEEMLMNWDHIRNLSKAGMDVQSHSHSHRVLHTLPLEEVIRDLRRSKSDLEGAIDRPVVALAYPTGRPIRDQPLLRQAVLDAGYRYGFTVQRLVPLARIHDWLDIPRMMIDRAVSDSFYRSTLAIPSLAY